MSPVYYGVVWQLDVSQLELMESILHNTGSIVLANNERIVVPDTLRFVWEVRCLDEISYNLILNNT